MASRKRDAGTGSMRPIGINQNVLEGSLLKGAGARGMNLITKSIFFQKAQKARHPVFLIVEMVMIFEHNLFDLLQLGT